VNALFPTHRQREQQAARHIAQQAAEINHIMWKKYENAELDKKNVKQDVKNEKQDEVPRASPWTTVGHDAEGHPSPANGPTPVAQTTQVNKPTPRGEQCGYESVCGKVEKEPVVATPTAGTVAWVPGTVDKSDYPNGK